MLASWKRKLQQWPLFHSNSSLLSCSAWTEVFSESFVLLPFLLRCWEHRTCADYFTESFHHNLSLPFPSLFVSSHRLNPNKMFKAAVSCCKCQSPGRSQIRSTHQTILFLLSQFYESAVSFLKNCLFDPLSLHFVLTQGAVVRYVGDGKLVENVNAASALISAAVTGQMSACMIYYVWCFEVLQYYHVDKWASRTTGWSFQLNC